MSEPTIPPPPPPISPSPFDPQAPIRPARGGCPKPVLIGCLVALVLGGILLLGGVYYVGKNFSQLMLFSFDQVEKGIKAGLPSDLPADERQRLDAAFASARRAVQASNKNPERAQQIQLQLLEVTKKGQDGRMTRQEVREVTEILERIGGTGDGAKPGTG